MTKKIVHLVYSMGCGGLEKVIVNLINASADYDCEHIIVTLTPEYELIDLIEADIQVYCVDKKLGKDVLCHWRLFKLFKQIKPDVLNTYNFGTIEYQMIASLSGIKWLVHSDHGRGGDDAKGQNSRNNFVRRFMSGFIDEYIVVSKDLYRWVKDVIKIKSKSVRIIQNGVALENYTAQNKDATYYKFCTVGRLDPVKNQTLMINAYARALQKNEALKQTKLEIVGDGPIKAELASLIESHQLGSHIKLLGYRENIAEILSQANAFILSSNYEAMPMTILEAMASRVPVVTTDVGGIRHFISDQEVTFVPSSNVELLADSFINLYTNPHDFIDKIDKAYTLVSSQYSLAQMCKIYMQVYKVI
ncbi:glycosyltransferase [Paraglaciecola aquimarina]|uniref:Glycosyltransferase n=1 Tax=Paraglaciecola aquimarina TaxID=1235557 RepID=A0ABU3T256_9ALTE|nr:glycosyltransferase [Paraglaciecola aquimarina]MDU0356349.1 glycosyltransferase [Paraglaciecola aquimarina]